MPIPGFEVIGESIFSIQSMVCFNSKEFDEKVVPIDFLAVSRKSFAFSLPNRPLEALDKRLVSLVKFALAMSLADGYSFNKAQIDEQCKVETFFSSSGNNMVQSLEIDCFNLDLCAFF